MRKLSDFIILYSDKSKKQYKFIVAPKESVDAKCYCKLKKFDENMLLKMGKQRYYKIV